MGLFDFLKKSSNNSNSSTPSNKSRNFRSAIEQDMYKNNTMGYRDTRDHLDYQNALLSRVNAAQARYKQDGDIDAVIRELEYAFVNADPPCNTSQNIDLAKYYVKAGQNDKAWGYLNMLYSKRLAPYEKIRFEQAKILKKEKKWEYAIEMYMLGYLAKSEWNNTFQAEMFKKDIQSSVNKLGWDEEKVMYLSYLIDDQVKKKNYSEGDLSSKYRKFCEDIKILS